MRRALSVLAALGLGLGTIALATPAQASPVTPDCTTDSITPLTGDSQTFSITTAGACDSVKWGNPDGLPLADIVVEVNGVPLAVNSFSPPGALTNGISVTLVYSGTASGELVFGFEDGSTPPQNR